MKNTAKQAKQKVHNLYSFNDKGRLEINLTFEKGLEAIYLSTNADRNYRLMLNILKHNKNLTIYTDTDILAHDDYIDALKNNGHKVIFELSDSDSRRKQNKSSASNLRMRIAFEKLCEVVPCRKLRSRNVRKKIKLTKKYINQPIG